MIAVDDSELFGVVWSLLSPVQSKKAVRIKINDVNDTILHHTSRNNPESLRVILQSLSENERFDAGKITNNSGLNVFHCAVENPESLKAVLESLSHHQRLDAVKIRDQYGYTVLHAAVAQQDTNSLEAILKSLPEKERLEAVKSTDRVGSTVLRYAVVKQDSDSFEAILRLLSENDRSRVIYAIEHPYLDFLYQHWEFITTNTTAALAAIMAYVLFPFERPRFMDSVSNAIGSLFSGTCSFFSFRDTRSNDIEDAACIQPDLS